MKTKIALIVCFGVLLACGERNPKHTNQKNPPVQIRKNKIIESVQAEITRRSNERVPKITTTDQNSFFVLSIIGESYRLAYINNGLSLPLVFRFMYNPKYFPINEDTVGPGIKSSKFSLNNIWYSPCGSMQDINGTPIRMAARCPSYPNHLYVYNFPELEDLPKRHPERNAQVRFVEMAEDWQGRYKEYQVIGGKNSPLPAEWIPGLKNKWNDGSK